MFLRFSSQGHYDNFNFKIASSPDAAANAYEAYSSVFADFHSIQEDEDVEWRINRREAAAAAQSGADSYYGEGSGGNYNDLSFEDYEKARACLEFAKIATKRD